MLCIAKSISIVITLIVTLLVTLIEIHSVQSDTSDVVGGG